MYFRLERKKSEIFIDQSWLQVKISVKFAFHVVLKLKPAIPMTGRLSILDNEIHKEVAEVRLSPLPPSVFMMWLMVNEWLLDILRALRGYNDAHRFVLKER